MSWSATCAARIARRSGAIPSSAAIWSRRDRPRFQRLIRRQNGGRASGKVDENFRNTKHMTELRLEPQAREARGDWKLKGVTQMYAKHVLIAACTLVVLGGGVANAGPCNTGQNADNKAGQEAKQRDAQTGAEQPKSGATTTGQTTTAGEPATASSSKMTDTNQSPAAPSQGADTSTKMADQDC
jgi:hypothetical protein